MSGIYIHIPFCKSKCSYCDFYSVANKLRIPDFINALLLEIDRKSYLLKDRTIKTIYFGGGTPSIVPAKQIEQILSKLYSNFQIGTTPEISFEANPDDLSKEYLNQLHSLGINRLSVGIQSLDNDILRFLRRKHTAQTALNCIDNAAKVGFQNISIDLIYGIPDLTNQIWNNNLIKALSLPVQHLSAYHLGIEKGTLLYKQLQKKQFSITNEEYSFKQYSELIEVSNKMKMYQYEVSNFAKQGFQSKHNSAYWKHIDYLGFGPSAHSFYNNTRANNSSSLLEYLDAKNENTYSETLNKTDLHNEVIMISLRTTKGIDLRLFKEKFGVASLYLLKKNLSQINPEMYNIDDQYLCLTKEGMFISDSIILDLFA